MSFHTASDAGYGTATRAIGTDRDVEYRVFGQVTGALSRAQRPGAAFSELAAALHDNTRLWTVIGIDLARPDNALPDALRARLISLAIFSRKHARRILAREPAADAEVLIEINRAVMGGLKGAPRATPGCAAEDGARWPA